MRLEENDFLRDVTCPHCGVGLDVRIDYDDEHHPIDQIGECPRCRKSIMIRSFITFIASKVQS